MYIEKERLDHLIYSPKNQFVNYSRHLVPCWVRWPISQTTKWDVKKNSVKKFLLNKKM